MPHRHSDSDSESEDEYVPTKNMKEMAANLAPHLAGWLTAPQIAKMLSIVHHHDNDLSFDVMIQAQHFIENPKKRKREALIEMESLKPVKPGKKAGGDKRQSSLGKPNAEKSFHEASKWLGEEENHGRFPRMATIANALLDVYEADKEKKQAAQDAYSIVLKIKKCLAENKYPDDEIEIKERWAEFDTHGQKKKKTK